MISAEKYNIIVRFGLFEEEECFEARVAEFPDIFEYADTQAEAYDLVIDAIETTQQILAEKNKNIPVPNSILDESFSGRVTLRMPKSLHKNMSELAKSEGMSLNNTIVHLLSQAQGATSALAQVVGLFDGFHNHFQNMLGMRENAMHTQNYHVDLVADNSKSYTIEPNSPVDRIISKPIGGGILPCS